MKWLLVLHLYLEALSVGRNKWDIRVGPLHSCLHDTVLKRALENTQATLYILMTWLLLLFLRRSQGSVERLAQLWKMSMIWLAPRLLNITESCGFRSCLD